MIGGRACVRVRTGVRARMRVCAPVRARLLALARSGRGAALVLGGHGVLRLGGRPPGARAGARLRCRVLLICHVSIVAAETALRQSG
ncbi:hypothetical protein [Streptomyces bluensis]|uniref:hypothetical protein n=1 Tax=Streptomyces bluensis TaxID=33897 RepID=UPI00167844B3|nr:hypothetical protein [Streptomyces bluensis]GGZ57697.1 hypothetical protein GCM10010344_24790 [Streptomyces bluensis]